MTTFEEDHPGLKGKAHETFVTDSNSWPGKETGKYEDCYLPEDIASTQIDKQKIIEALDKLAEMRHDDYSTECDIVLIADLKKELGL